MMPPVELPVICARAHPRPRPRAGDDEHRERRHDTESDEAAQGSIACSPERDERTGAIRGQRTGTIGRGLDGFPPHAHREIPSRPVRAPYVPAGAAWWVV